MISVYPNLDPLLFNYLPEREYPVLNALARKQILMDLAKVFTYIPIRWCVLSGDALRHSGESSVLKVVVGVEDRILMQPQGHFIRKGIDKVLRELNSKDRIVNGSRHPLKYMITTKPYTSYNFQDAYALIDDRWLASSYVPISEKVQVKRPTSKRHYMRNIFRGLDRKNPDYIPDIYKTKKTELSHAKVPMSAAKASQTGIWRISRLQAIEIAKLYHLSHLPKKIKPYKMLGNTGIMLLRPQKEMFFLVKGPYVRKIKNRYKNIVYA